MRGRGLGHRVIALGMIRGRHDLPVEDYVLDEVDNPSNYGSIRWQVSDRLAQLIPVQVGKGVALGSRYEDIVPVYYSATELRLYVTGLTAVTAEIIRWCATFGVPLTLMHYDKATEDYLPHVIFGQGEVMPL